MASDKNIETLGIDTARILAADAVQKANSGHPGTPMALAPMGHVLMERVFKLQP
jgi:transketolase